MYFLALNFTTIFIQKYFWALNFPSIFIQEKYFWALNSSFSDHNHDGLLRTGEEVGLYIYIDLFATCSGLVCDNYWYRLVGTKWWDSQSRFFAESLKHQFLTNRTRTKQSTAVCIVFIFYYSIIGDVSLPQFPFKLAWSGRAPLRLAEAATSIVFVATKDVFCHNKQVFVATKVCLSQQNFCQLFVVTKVLSRQTYFFHNKTFIMTSILLSHQKMCFVMTNVFCCDKRVFCHDKSVCGNKTLVVTKMILVAVPSNDTPDPSTACYHTKCGIFNQLA